MRNKNRTVISTGANVGSRRLVETPNGNVIAESLTGYDSLGNPRWTRTKSDLNNFVQEIGSHALAGSVTRITLVASTP